MINISRKKKSKELERVKGDSSTKRKLMKLKNNRQKNKELLFRVKLMDNYLKILPKLNWWNSIWVLDLLSQIIWECMNLNSDWYNT